MRRFFPHAILCAVFSTAVFQMVMAQNTSPYWSLAGNSNTTTATKLGTTNSVSLRFYAGNVQRMMIGYSSGNVAIGTTSLTHRLTVGGNGRFTTGLTVDNGGLSANNNSGIGVSGSGSIWGVVGTGESGAGVYGAGSDFTGVSGQSTSGIGTAGESASSYGVYGTSQTGTGVSGTSQDGYGGSFSSQTDWGLVASSTNYAGVFYGKVYTSTGYETSDRNLKQNIKEFDGAIGIINKLKPRHYEFRTDAQYTFLNLPKGSHYGLIAQDVEEVLPNLVSTAKHRALNHPRHENLSKRDASAKATVEEKSESFDLKAVNYTELVPIMVKGMQEQNAVIEKLLQRISDLEGQVSKLKEGRGTNAITGTLSQATPNPARGSTRISYSLPQGTSRAQLLLTDNGGKTVKVVSLNAAGVVDVSTAGLSSGVYNYSLFVDGKVLETKKLTVAR